LKQFFAVSGAAKKRREDAEAQLAPALEKITEALTEHWSTGSGRRLRQIIWSIYNARTLVILGDVLTNFDDELGEAVATLIHAKLCGVDMDDLLREVLKRSGEFARYEEAERETPENEMVIYPPCRYRPSLCTSSPAPRPEKRRASRKSVAWRRAALLKTERRMLAQATNPRHSAGRSGAPCAKVKPTHYPGRRISTWTWLKGG
jgi:hypothetical protein